MPPFLQSVIDQISKPLFWGLAGTLALLVVGTVVAVVLPLFKPGKDWTNLRQRVASWWVMIGLVSIALVAGWGR